MNVICVDDEKPALDNFRLTVKNFSEIDSLNLFQRGKEAVEWVKGNHVDVAFLDMEMKEMHGLELAKRMKKEAPDICIIFITAFDQYELQAFRVDAIGYVLKPYTRQDIRKELEKAMKICQPPGKRIYIQTIPGFAVFIDGERMLWGRAKVEELFAVFVDRGSEGVTAGEAISCLWPERVADDSTRSLYRMTYKRLLDTLKEKGIEDIISSDGRKKYLLTEQVECDLYSILEGDREAVKNYGGEYMRQYSWAEMRNAQLSNIKFAD